MSIRNIIDLLISVKAQHDREIIDNVYDWGFDMFKTLFETEGKVRLLVLDYLWLYTVLNLSAQ